MSRSKDDSGQAFPCLERGGSGLDLTDGGMTLRQYAAIKLRVPNSGTDWLDEMIRTSLRDEIAGRAMQGMLSDVRVLGAMISGPDSAALNLAASVYEQSDAMLKARN